MDSRLSPADYRRLTVICRAVVSKMVHRFRPWPHLGREDLFSIAMTGDTLGALRGALSAHRTFDPARSKYYSTYVGARARSALLDKLRRLKVSDWNQYLERRGVAPRPSPAVPPEPRRRRGRTGRPFPRRVLQAAIEYQRLHDLSQRELCRRLADPATARMIGFDRPPTRFGLQKAIQRATLAN